MGEKKAPSSSEFTTKLILISRKKQFLLGTLFQRWNLPVHSGKQIQSQLFPPYANIIKHDWEGHSLPNLLSLFWLAL